MGDTHVGLQARLMSQALRKLAGSVSRSEDVLDLHQPDPRKDRSDVRFQGDDPRGAGAQVLLVGPARRPPHRLAQGRRRDRRLPGAREGRQEQGRGPVQARPSSTSSTAPGSRRKAACSTSRSSTASSASRERGSSTATTSWARAARTPRPSSPRTPTSPTEIELKIKDKLGIAGHR